MSGRHRPRLDYRDEGHDHPPLRRMWRASCSCGHQGPERRGWAALSKAVRAEAAADREAHLEEVAAPPERRCRALKEHGTKWWDPCELCAGQMALPGLEPA